MILCIRRKVTVCKAIADEGYDQDLGIRSLIAVLGSPGTMLRVPCTRHILDVDEKIEGERITACPLDVRGGEVVAKPVAVKAD
ncbi:uncharacterized protein Z519_03064 [Cladophialophora bantiana CBS 173.52]|uniref:Uncharacterized protein n=1 Tax=Cladophialophora bantiana (strain ATCC 10958 / CBS 173.52 / CDC B-1940 / NIH 8579) TaxID=1442370 RepID=A0A0D2HRD3_CLAB1|nr:uncharacterized protein Z519_03064 [Cladophialophora bantiana CBS 173.52]KIW95998.1 hypothetical protein Z519_03064 [Cladophialophora bantiana CBS 173.52]